MVNVHPAGYIELTPAGSRFVPIRDYSGLLTMATVFAGLTLLLLMRRLLAHWGARRDR